MTVFLPFCGEFGWMIMKHIHQVHAHKGERKIVYCERGQECLFPSAVEFRYDWAHPVPVKHRIGSGGLSRREAEGMRQLERDIRNRHPDCEIVKTIQSKVQSAKFELAVDAYLPKVDVVIAPRYREFEPKQNFNHWPSVIDSLTAAGLKVGLAGTKEQSIQGLSSTSVAWDHPDGPTAGSVDLLKHCRLYVGTDSGVSHLAAFMDVPMMVFRFEGKTPSFLEAMKESSRGYFQQIDSSAWNDPELISNNILNNHSTSLSVQKSSDRFVFVR